MGTWLLSNEATIRAATFVALLVSFGLAETFFPRRPLAGSRGFRWIQNLGLVAIDTVVLRLVFPLLAVEFALWVQANRWGALNIVDLPLWLAIPLAMVGLDFAIYLQHRLFHAVPVLWRLHMVHHADVDLDVTTGARFHPLEMILSLGIKMAVVAAIGAPPVAVLLFELLLNATSMFNHSNINLPPLVDRAIRTVLVTPDMHRVHHSVDARETNSNFGFNHPWWDHVLGSYRDQPRAGHRAMSIGLTQYLGNRRQSLLWMLKLPLVGTVGGYPGGKTND